jgi:hypothetical protein
MSRTQKKRPQPQSKQEDRIVELELDLVRERAENQRLRVSNCTAAATAGEDARRECGLKAGGIASGHAVYMPETGGASEKIWEESWSGKVFPARTTCAQAG